MNKKNNNNQRGSALLLTLGILSLALILAMSFAFSARTNRQVAMVNADQIKARLLAESGWQRLRASMEWNFGAISYDSLAKTFTKIGTYYYPPVDGRLGFSDSNKLTSNHYEQRYTTISASATDDSEESFNKLDKIFSNHSALFKDLEGMGLSITGTKFQTILDAGKVGSPVTGRLGFLILEEGGKFDINQLVSPIVSSPPPPDNIPFVKLDTRIPPNYQGEQLAKFGLTFDYENDFYYNILGNYSVGSYIEPNTKRLGLCMQELIVDALFDTSRLQS